MGQKVNPVAMRIGVNKDWNSRWFASDKDYASLLLEDIKLREYIEKHIPRSAYISHIEIEKKKTEKGHFIHIAIFAARPALIIGDKGETVKALRLKLLKLVGKGNDIKLDVVEVKNYQLDARIVADMICNDLEARASFRIVQKRAIQNARKAGAKGIKTEISGRLGGAEIARSEGYKEGTMAINTLRSDIDFATREAKTTYGKLGVKIWICRGEVQEKRETSEEVKENKATKKGE